MLRSMPPMWIGIQGSSLNSFWGLNSSFLPVAAEDQQQQDRRPPDRASPEQDLPLGRELREPGHHRVPPVGLGEQAQDHARAEVDGEEDQGEHRGGEAGVLAGGEADDQHRQRDDPGAGEPCGAQPAHRGATITALDGACDGPVRAELDPVKHEPDPRDDEVARHGQVRCEEDGQSDREQNEVEVAEDVGHAGRAGAPLDPSMASVDNWDPHLFCGCRTSA